ncbi:MAG: hypothetical protein RL468_1231 [Pseudomonadota bacterium]|jgi:S1-C subfamily serine protease
MMPQSIRSTILWIALLGWGLAAWAQVPPVRLAPLPNPLRADASLSPRLIQMKKIVAHANNAVVGEMRRGADCAEATPIRFSSQTVAGFSRSLFVQFRNSSAELGYPVPTAPNPNRSVFETEPLRSEPDFDLGLTIRSLESRLCSPAEGLVQGGVWMQVRWEVYSPKAQKVLLDLTTEGHWQGEQPERMAPAAPYTRAFAAAAGNFLGAQAYFDLLHGKTPIPEPENFKPIRIPAVAEPAGSVQSNYAQLVNSTVTLTDGSRSGSGFLISGQGYLLTNQHVLGDQKFMKVRLGDGREQMAELVRSNRARDVALMKLSAPAGLPLHLAAKLPAPGEDAFVMGSPLGKTFAGTLTRGVVSGVRQIGGKNFIQSDARILPGSSGGPLLDARSRVIGMAVSGVNAGAAGINLFIPIQEALQVLAIEIE